MTRPDTLTSLQLRDAAHEAIKRELGVAGLLRYLRENHGGGGDYTRDREAMIPEFDSSEELLAFVRTTVAEMRARGEMPAASTE